MHLEPDVEGMSEMEQLEGAADTGAQSEKNLSLPVQTEERIMVGVDCDLVPTSISAPSAELQGGSRNDLTLEGANTMDQRGADATNSSPENGTKQMMDTSVSEIVTNPSGSVANYLGSNNIIEAPREGMVFANHEEIERYYRDYGAQQGFGVVKSGAGMKRNNCELRNVTWRCECGGSPDKRRRAKGSRLRIREEEINTSAMTIGGRPSKSKKCGCTAMIYATVRDDDSWVLKRVVLEHKNHTLTPGKTRELKISPYIKKRMFAEMIANLGESQIQNILANEKGGVNQVFMPERVIRNSQEGRLKFQEGDRTALLKFVMRMLKGNQKFFHFMRHDDCGYLTDLLWVDARSRAAYEEFGDAVCLDTAYLTNDYDLPLVKFVGVNHHGQTLLFGCALISHEDLETYNWLFGTWLLCMDGKEPDRILTDQCSSIGRALATVLPKTAHRWSTWDIVRKFPRKLGLVPRYQEFFKVMKNVIYHSCTVDEFERCWIGVIHEYQLQGNEWLQCLFQDRQMWVPAYINNMFWAGMNSMERAQSVHSIFDAIVLKHTKLYEFLELYCFAMEETVKTEKDADDDCARYVRGVATHFKVEKLFQKMYTDAKFRQVQMECLRVLYCNSREEKFVSETELEYVMQDRVWVEVPGKKESIPSDEKRLYRVRFNTSTNEVSCDCKLFDSSGIICRHSIRLFDLHSVSVVPEKYILTRWQKDIQRKYTRVKAAYYDPSLTEGKRFDMMQLSFEAICLQAMKRDDAFDIVMHSLADMKLRVTECLEKPYSGRTAECSNGPVPMRATSSAGIDNSNANMDDREVADQDGDSFCQDVNINGEIISTFI